MTIERINSLSSYLANFSGPTKDSQIEDPIPWTGYVYVVQILLDDLANFVGKQDSAATLEAIQNQFSKFPLLETQFDQVWNKCDSDDEFFAQIEALLSRKKGS